MGANTDREHLLEALALAEQGRGMTSPNPIVGAVIVRDGVVVGRGFHARAGGDHAEVIALREAGDKAHGATLYVTMEPCCHYGKTPPCTDAIIASGVKRVVAAMEDPNPLVCGGGVACLSGKGIMVETGQLRAEAERQNEAYRTYITTRLPFVTLKLAVSLDGRVCDASGRGCSITGDVFRERSHRLRSWSDAVMVGIGTVLADDPQLTVRAITGRNPKRIVVDSTLRLPPDARVITPGGLIVATTDTAPEASAKILENLGVEIVRFPAQEGHVPLASVLRYLGEHGIVSVLCEGGTSLAGSLLRERLVHKVVVAVAPLFLGAGPAAIDHLVGDTLADAIRLRDVTHESFGDDMCVTGYPVYSAEH